MRRFSHRLRALAWPGRTEHRFQINLSRRYRPLMAPLRAVLIGCCAMLTVGIVWDLRQVREAYEACRTLEIQLEQARQQNQAVISEARHEGVDLSAEALSRLPVEVNLANDLLEKRAFSWTAFLTELERALPPRLALSSIRFDQGGTMVRLTGTAMNLEDITTFTIGLQDHATFKDPVLAEHRIGSNGLVEFNVTVRYHLGGV